MDTGCTVYLGQECGLTGPQGLPIESTALSGCHAQQTYYVTGCGTRWSKTPTWKDRPHIHRQACFGGVLRGPRCQPLGRTPVVQRHLDRHEAHTGPAGGLADGGGIVGVAFPTLAGMRYGVTRWPAISRGSRLNFRESISGHRYCCWTGVVPSHSFHPTCARCRAGPSSRTVGPAMHIRAAISADLQSINTITLAAKAHWGYSSAQLHAWRTDLLTTAESLSQRPTLVALDNGSVVGVAQVDPSATPWELVSCWVAPSHMRRGIGSALLNAMKAEVARSGERTLHIDSDPNAEPFYLAVGAVRIGQVPAPIPGSPERVRPQLRLATSGA